MKKVRVVLSSILILSMIFLGACSSSSSGDADGKKEITFMFRGGPDEKTAYTEAIKKFEEAHEGVSVKIINTDADQYSTKLSAAVSGGNIPDVFYLDSGSIANYVDNGIIKDITEEVEKANFDLNSIWPFGTEIYRYDGETPGKGALYGLPKDVGPFALGYNKDMFEEAGIPLPDVDKAYTWEEFLKVSQEITKDTNGDGEVDQWASGFNATWTLQSFAYSNGASFLNESGDTVTVDTPEFASSLQFLTDLTNKYNTTPNASQAETLDTYQRWMNGELAFFPIGPWDMSTYAKLDFEYDLMPWPSGTTGESVAYVGSLGLVVSETTQYPDLATELAIYLSADESAQQTLLDAQVQIPNLIDMAEEWAADTESVPSNKKEFLDIIQDYGTPYPTFATYNSQWLDEFWTNITPVMQGKQTAEDFVKEIQPKMQKLLDEANEQAKMSK
ncbi:ABC transporter substrate-binding protein [Bacillus sp. B1-b2]|uniref:ABC transporter substrate-binding protein n=1 Tax=Bacillus sp. B1-b2 TaxID=2653201 RepID=UPI0012613BA8|nr:sugar ABC transporter substrate-binding protein [Bacillus sp. B1-b2]KAB7666318.1 sugar ABC transporter substrate-binding protein [Bacillus sp. B1-b2]